MSLESDEDVVLPNDLEDDGHPEAERERWRSLNSLPIPKHPKTYSRTRLPLIARRPLVLLLFPSPPIPFPPSVLLLAPTGTRSQRPSNSSYHHPPTTLRC